MARYPRGPVVSDRRTWIAIAGAMVATVVFLAVGLLVAPALASLIGDPATATIRQATPGF